MRAPRSLMAIAAEVNRNARFRACSHLSGSAPAAAVSTMRLPLTRTSAKRGGAPVPSRSRASRKSRLLILLPASTAILRLLASHLRNSDARHRLKQANIHWRTGTWAFHRFGGAR